MSKIKNRHRRGIAIRKINKVRVPINNTIPQIRDLTASELIELAGVLVDVRDGRGLGFAANDVSKKVMQRANKIVEHKSPRAIARATVLVNNMAYEKN